MKPLDLRMRRANFEQERTLEGFALRFNPDLPRGRIVDLGSCSFIERREDVLFIGPTGTGTRHLAQPVDHRARRRRISALFTPEPARVAQLHAARGDGTHDRKVLRLIEPPLRTRRRTGLAPRAPPGRPGAVGA